MLVIALLLAAAPKVERVDVDLGGVGHTKANAVRRLMTTRDGTLLDEETLRRDVARLRSTGILYDVEERTFAGQNAARVALSLKDRWTLLPMFGLRRGGGRTAARARLSDHQTFRQPFSLYRQVSRRAAPGGEGDLARRLRGTRRGQGGGVAGPGSRAGARGSACRPTPRRIRSQRARVRGPAPALLGCGAGPGRVGRDRALDYGRT